ncbi:MAG: hypothetical protein NVSMB52_06300 [Chloroflexota bacterium]
MGAKQKITVTTVPGVHVTIKLFYPNRTKKVHTGTAGDDGILTWSYKQPKNKATAKNRTVKVVVTVIRDSDSPVRKNKKYTIG